MCFVLSDVCWHVPYSDVIDTETRLMEWICMYVRPLSMYITSVSGKHNQSCMGSSSRMCTARSTKVSLYYMHKWWSAIYTLFLFITSIYYRCILVYVHFCRWQRGILRNLYSGKEMCMFPVTILYVVYSMLLVDLLCRIESCVVYVHVGNTLTWSCIPDTLVIWSCTPDTLVTWSCTPDTFVNWLCRPD